MHNFYEPKKCAHDTVYTNPISYGQGQAPTIKTSKVWDFSPSCQSVNIKPSTENFA